MATQGRTPIPKKQKEIANSLPNPYEPLEKGNPNISPDLNRGKKTSMKGDNVKPFSIGIKDIDESIMYYFKNVIKPFVMQNGQRIEVPVMYSNPERWKGVQADGFIRDKSGKIMSPLIIFRRNTITKNRSITNKLDANSPYNLEYFQKRYNKSNSYSNFDVLNNRKPTTKNYAVVVPDYVDLVYSCIIYTYYVEQLNGIIEAINYSSDSYWGDPERFKFKATIDSFSTPVEMPAGDIRSVRANFDINLYGYIIPNIIQKNLTTNPVRFSTGQVIFNNETVSGDINNAQSKPFDPSDIVTNPDVFIGK